MSHEIGVFFMCRIRKEEKERTRELEGKGVTE